MESYNRPQNVQELISLMDQGAVCLAGGTQVNGVWGQKKNISALADLRDVVPQGIRGEGETLVFGALTTLQQIVDDPQVPRAFREAAGFFPSRSIRNVSTLGGQLGSRRSDSYLIPALLAFQGQVRCAGGELLSVEDYLNNPGKKVILEVILPASRGVVVVKEARSQLAPPVVNAAVSFPPGGGPVVAAGCTGSGVKRLTSVEEGLAAGRLDKREALEQGLRESLSPPGDILGSAAFKTYLNVTLIADAIEKAREVQK